MSERKEGWYWVKVVGLSQWQVLQWCIEDEDDCDWTDASGDGIYRVTKIGPRIPTPDEPWQAVPNNGTTEQMDDAARGFLLMLSMRSDISYERLREEIAMRGEADLINALPEYAQTDGGHIPKAAQADIFFRLMCSAAPKPEDVCKNPE